jgi:POT family proton-dependent oligopeptide transporter
MAVGYFLIAIPTPTPVPDFALYLTLTCIGLFVIAFGNGLFKGNLQAVVGQMYDKPEYSAKRDTGFQIFYMFINIGALFAPLIAVGVRNWWVEKNGFAYNSDLPALCHHYIEGSLSPEALKRLTELSTEVSKNGVPADLGIFAREYLNVFNTGFHYAFAAAIIAMLISLVIYISNKNKLPNPADKQKTTSADGKAAIEMSSAEIKQRLYALFAVFGVVIFFWFSFHQNGVTLTFFANDYTDLSAINIDLGFTTIKGAEIFQFFNPFFVVLLTPVVIGFFNWLRVKGKEPSTPGKIAIGMGIAASAFAVMALGSFGLPDAAAVKEAGGLADAARVSPFLLIGTYFILTVAELFISPLGLSFVSKVAPVKYQGIMQGAWLGATALGNQLLIFGTIFYENIPIWATWMVFVTACTLSMTTMLLMVKWLDRVAK